MPFPLLVGMAVIGMDGGWRSPAPPSGALARATLATEELAPPSGYRASWYEQRVDHFNSLSGGQQRFRQRYLVDDAQHVAGGPIFAFTGAEGGDVRGCTSLTPDPPAPRLRLRHAYRGRSRASWATTSSRRRSPARSTALFYSLSAASLQRALHSACPTRSRRPPIGSAFSRLSRSSQTTSRCSPRNRRERHQSDHGPNESAPRARRGGHHLARALCPARRRRLVAHLPCALPAGMSSRARDWLLAGTVTRYVAPPATRPQSSPSAARLLAQWPR